VQVFCSFATPNLWLWKLLALPGGQTKALPLPVFDRRMPYDKTKKYVLIETNEGDTPRIVVSVFSKSWTDPRRGSLPVSWAIDPMLADEFPALFDYFSTTASTIRLSRARAAAAVRPPVAAVLRAITPHTAPDSMLSAWL